MQNINKIRALFAKPKGDEDKILELLENFLEQLMKKSMELSLERKNN